MTTESESRETRSKFLSSGDILRSRYRIIRSLGSGNFVEGVHDPYSRRNYLAEDLDRSNEYRVLKQFAPQLKQTFALKKAQELFEWEAGVMYRLQHPQIPQFRELFRYQKERAEYLFLVQYFVEGRTYQALLNRRVKKNARFSEEEVKQLLAQVLPILEYIHSMGIMHRHITPHNLILRSQDELPVLVDFGCIKEVEHRTQLQSGVAANSAIPLSSTAFDKSYAPLEQVERGIVYAHSDLYALAATCVVLLTGKEPQQLIDSNGDRWKWKSQVTLSPKLKWILSTMLSPNPRNRFTRAAEISQILRDISITALSPSTETAVESTSKSEKPNRKALSTPNISALGIQLKSLLFVDRIRK